LSLQDINDKIGAACKTAARPRHSVELVAVSKVQPLERVRAVLDAGQRVFGENRVQEATERWLPLREEFADVKLHLIGHLQTNKAKEAVRLFDAIETIDSERIADAVKTEMDKQGKTLGCFLQVNTGDEAQKDGVALRDVEKLLRHCREELKLEISGLMCIPPQDDIPDLHFALLHKIATAHKLPNLSMGMSADFEIAIRYGATHVRVGSALFGVRENTKSL